jgi:hypothetical protein
VALIECKDCHTSVSEAAVNCPNCGCPTKLASDEEVSETLTNARSEEKRAETMAWLWCAVGVGGMMLALYQESSMIMLICVWAIIGATYQFYQRNKFKNLIQDAESAGAQGKTFPHPS